MNKRLPNLNRHPSPALPLKGREQDHPIREVVLNQFLKGRLP